MARKKDNVLADIIALSSKLPWWAGVALGLASYVFLHRIASAPANLDPIATTQQMADRILPSLIHALSSFLQYVVPLCFFSGALFSAISAAKNKARYVNTMALGNAAAVKDLTWREFEELVAQHFRELGYTAATNTPGPDGGIDIKLTKGRELFLVQCKQWRATKVGVDVVRQLYGVMAATGAVGAFVVSSGRFTPDAQEFCTGRNITLIDGSELVRQMTDVLGKGHRETDPWPVDGDVEPPKVGISCFRCGSPMKIRQASKGARAGQSFYGCTKYPKSSHTQPL